MRALVRRPSPRLAEGIVSHIERQPVDVALADTQWHAYGAALAAHGWEVVEVPPAPHCPDSVFIEDAVVMFDDLAVLTRPGAESRRDEVTEVAPVVQQLGLEVARIEAPACFDGGDVLKVGRTVYVGRSARTDAEGVRQLRSLLSPRGWEVVAVPLTKVLHLKSAITALPDGTIIGWPPALDTLSLFPRFLAMPEEEGAHVVDLGEGRLLVSAAAPRSIELLAELGYVPVPVDIGEFVKLEGCVTCLSVRVRTEASAVAATPRSPR
jgi:dimethylargininase